MTITREYVCVITLVHIALAISCFCATSPLRLRDTLYQVEECEFGSVPIGREEFSDLLVSQKVDSLYAFINRYTYVDSSIIAIDSLYNTGYSVYSTVEFMLSKSERVTFIVLDSAKNYVRLLLNKKFEKGHHVVALDISVIEQSFRTDQLPIFILLEIIGREHKYDKHIILK